MNILDIVIKEVGGIPTLDKMLSIRDQVVRQWNKKGYISYGFQMLNINGLGMFSILKYLIIYYCKLYKNSQSPNK